MATERTSREHKRSVGGSGDQALQSSVALCTVDVGIHRRICEEYIAICVYTVYI